MLYQPATPLRPAGYGGTGPSPALALLDVTHGHALGVRRLGSGTVALVRGPAVLLQQPSRVSPPRSHSSSG